MTVQEALGNLFPSSSTAEKARGTPSYFKWSLLRSLHQLSGSLVGHGGNEIREIVASPYLTGQLIGWLMRHVEALRAECNQVICEYLNMSATFFAADTTCFVRCSSFRTLSGGSSSKREDPDLHTGDKKSNNVHVSTWY